VPAPSASLNSPHESSRDRILAVRDIESALPLTLSTSRLQPATENSSARILGSYKITDIEYIFIRSSRKLHRPPLMPARKSIAQRGLCLM
jgi:hypothetical protein